MDHFQAVVSEYLRADRAMFLNTECLINLDGGGVYAKGRHWYCDAVAVNHRERIVYLCEVTYSQSLQSLLGCFRSWAQHWPELCEALRRDSSLVGDWTFQPWAFIPEKSHHILADKLALSNDCSMPAPKVTYLEAVTPWNYSTWDRRETAFAELRATLEDAELSSNEVAEVVMQVETSGGRVEVLQLAAEGGSISVHRVQGGVGPRFCVTLSESGYGPDDEASTFRVLGESPTLAGSFGLLDRYPWTKLFVRDWRATSSPSF